MKKVILQSGRYYHIYNRAGNCEPIFADDDDFRFFISLYKSYVVPVADTYAYCLLHDHLHLLVRIREETNGNSYKSFAFMFNAYAKGHKKKNNATGKVFMYKLKRVEVRRDNVFCDLVKYINLNPCLHGEVDHPADFRYCSFRATFASCPTLIRKDELYQKFGSLNALTDSFCQPANEATLKRYMLE